MVPQQPLQLVTGQLDGAGGAAHGGKHRVKPPQGQIQVGFHVLRQGEGAHTAYGVADALHRLLRGEHFAFMPKRCLYLLLSILASPAATTRMGSSPSLKLRVLAMRAGSHPTAWAASSTVALDTLNS